jgi:hypothetical protein
VEPVLWYSSNSSSAAAVVHVTAVTRPHLARQSTFTLKQLCYSVCCRMMFAVGSWHTGCIHQLRGLPSSRARHQRCHAAHSAGKPAALWLSQLCVVW